MRRMVDRELPWAMALAAVALVGGLVGCGDEGGKGARSTRGATSSTTMPVGSGASHLQGPRSPIADGLVVPSGAKLAGAVFREIPYDLSDEEPGMTAPTPGVAEEDLPWEALLVIDGDPFAVYDDLAGQIRGDAVGLPMPGTADSCTWAVADPVPMRPGEGPGGPMGKPIEESPDPGTASASSTVPATGGPTDGFESDGQGEIEMEHLRAEIVAESPPPDGTVGVSCDAQVVTADRGGTRIIELDLSGERDLPPTLRIRSSWTDGASVEPGVTAQVTTMLGQTTSSGVGPEPGPEQVPAGKANELPVLAGQPAAQAGDLFGPYVNCFIVGSSKRMEVPDGAVLVGTGWERGEDSVLAVTDADEAIADIARQVEGPTRSSESDISRDSYDVASGETITRYSHSVMAGGGGCSVLTSPDGRYLRISAHSD